jgi:peroxiredoxin
MQTQDQEMTLKESIDQFMGQMAGKAPKELLETVGGEIRKLAESGIAAKALKAGAKAPEFSLPDPQGRIDRLTDLLQEGPVVVTFYRGSWCPFCNLQLRAYQKALPEIEKLGATLVAISPQTPDHSLTIVEKAELTFPVLTDQGNHVGRQYGLVYHLSEALQSAQKAFGSDITQFNGDSSWELPMPGLFVIDQTGVIRFASADPNWMNRVEPSVILQQLKALAH